MEYIYGALMLHSLGKDITEASVKKVLEGAGAKPEDAKVKALVSALEGVDIKEAISKSFAMAAAPVAAAPAGEAKHEAKEEESPKEQEKKAEEAASGLASLFG